ncbi:MAG: LysR family transcriptional regulator [Caballeronia sp.]|uniref:LysR substrate-binding domain-containing protein n=1 Tax=Caballeronia sp. TaxID=1931223 RepID=UPI00260E5AB2|nr:LysR substrate-binding domain-containing protein [Caballeronia sp.]MDB5832970.1 LysR family transcriptional regulator [Caballeronia sp.]
MSIREIEVFRAVMTAGTTSKAAGLLGVSQPAVSQSIRKLETLAGLRLFERVRGRLLPTQEAFALMTEVDRYFVGYEAIEHRIRSLGLFGLGRLALASYPAFGNCFLARAIADFAPQERSMQMTLQVMSSRAVHEQVSGGHVDFGLMNDEVAVHGLEHSQFANFQGVVVMSPKHRLARKRVIDATDLATDNFISLNPEDTTRRRLDSALSEHGVTLRSCVETPLSVTACELALSGVGLSIVHPIAALDFVPRGLVMKPLSFNVQFLGLLIFRPGKPLSENAKQFLSYIRKRLEIETAQVNEILGLTGTRAAKTAAAKARSHNANS